VKDLSEGFGTIKLKATASGGAKLLSMEAPRFSDPRWKHYRTDNTGSVRGVTFINFGTV
jgi:hypothetical protein